MLSGNGSYAKILIMKALVISGGGSKGAFAGGIAEYLLKDCGNKYDLLVGCSTGSLLLPHISLGKIEKIKQVYTTVTQKDIFSISPFIIRKTKKGYKTSINHFNTIRSFIKRSPTFGESKGLRTLIKNSITENEFEEIQKQQRKILLTVSNITQQTVEYISSDKCTYEDFCDWAWASANFIPFMSVFEHNGNQYADGGFGNHVPLSCALENGACDVDVIILDNENSNRNQGISKNPFSLLLKTMRFMATQISLKDVIIGKLMGERKRVDVRIYYIPEGLTDNVLVFDPEQMKQWWADGYEYAKRKKPVCYCYMPDGSFMQMEI